MSDDKGVYTDIFWLAWMQSEVEIFKLEAIRFEYYNGKRFWEEIRQRRTESDE